MAEHREFLLHFDIDKYNEMEQAGFVRIRNLGEPDPVLVRGILNQINRFDPNPVTHSDTPTRQYRGSSRSHFVRVLNQFTNSRINDVNIFQTHVDVSQERGRPSQPDVVFTNDTAENRPYRLGPIGHERGKAVTLILPMDTDLNSDDGFFLYDPSSFQWTDQEFEERLASDNITLEKMFIPRTEGILLPAETVVQFPTSKPGCHFVRKYYGPRIARLRRKDMDFEDQHVIPFNRDSEPYCEIDNY